VYRMNIGNEQHAHTGQDSKQTAATKPQLRLRSGQAGSISRLPGDRNALDGKAQHHVKGRTGRRPVSPAGAEPAALLSEAAAARLRRENDDIGAAEGAAQKDTSNREFGRRQCRLQAGRGHRQHTNNGARKAKMTQ
jgi:hypothetical protein